jgi:hypothetical protein
MNTSIINFADFVKIGIMAYAFIWFANRGLDAAGLSQFKS